MSRHTPREPRMAEVISTFCTENPPNAPVLVMNDPTDRVATACGDNVASWHRRAGTNRSASPWPQGGPFQTILLRLPKSKDELTMSLAASHSVLAKGGQLFLYGANDEGIKSAPPRLAPCFDRAVTLLTKGHARLIRATRSKMDAPKPNLAAWKEQVVIETPQGTLDITSYPGVFAHTRLDTGTATLLDRLPKTDGPMRVLDFGCGAGILSAAFLRTNPQADITLFDNDSVALEAARENVPKANTVLGSKLADLDDRQFDLILSNPPIHDGKEQDFSILEDLCRNAPRYLSKKGEIRMVVQRTAPAARLLGESFATVDLIGENKSFRVWRAQNSGGSID